MALNELLTVREMYAADNAAVDAGVASLELMETAGRAVADEIIERWPSRPVLVLCGPGNNGGDGFVIARLLVDAGWPVTLALLGERERLAGDAAANAARWSGGVEEITLDLLDNSPLVVDALFGAGLTRPLDGAALEVAREINARGLDCVAVDVPSGVHGDTGEILGAAPACALTVTFFRAKPGHMLVPGRDLCGDIVVADIGIPEAALKSIGPRTFANGPEIWGDHFPKPSVAGHKYHRGHAVILGGAEMTGAARLAAEAARRIGCGLLTLASPGAAADIYRTGAPGVIVSEVNSAGALRDLLADERKNAVLIGPGSGLGEGTRECVWAALATGRPVVLDADALTSYKFDPGRLFVGIKGPCILTPHEGEFALLFGDSNDSRLVRARRAADKTGAIIVLKGSDTVIVSPDGRAVINGSGTPYLASGGTGDVLAGTIVGLLAQGMAPFEAAQAAVWIHGAAAEAVGPGLIAEDLAARYPRILATVMKI